MSSKQVIVSGAFDEIQSRAIRFLEEASKLGEVTVLVWSDGAVEQFHRRRPRFPLAERLYCLNAVRYVSRAVQYDGPLDFDALPDMVSLPQDVWVDIECRGNERRSAFCRQRGLDYCVVPDGELDGFPDLLSTPSEPVRKKVVVTGCFDWFHSGHVRFFEEVGAYGALYVIVGHDANIRLLKGEGHPLFSQEQRRYAAASIRFVKRALVSTGDGWLDADPEIRELKPDIYAVNEDGDKGGKREYCAKLGIEYLVLKRTPAPGLPKRTSTNLRGF